MFTDRGAFCCAGCEAVFTLIAAHGLTRYYACEAPPGRPQRSSRIHAGRFAVLDEPAASRRLMEDLGEGRSAVTFQVPALHCASCLWLLEQLWRFDRGDRALRGRPAAPRRSASNSARTATSLAARRRAPGLARLRAGPRRRADARRGPAERRATSTSSIGVAGFAFGNVMLFSIPRYAERGAARTGGSSGSSAVSTCSSRSRCCSTAPPPYFRNAPGASLRIRRITLEVPVALGLAVLFGRSAIDIATGWGEGFLDSFAGLVFFLLIGRLFQQKAFDGHRLRSHRAIVPAALGAGRTAGIGARSPQPGARSPENHSHRPDPSGGRDARAAPRSRPCRRGAPR